MRSVRCLSFLLTLFLFVLFSASAQTYEQVQTVLFYNCENLFDPADDPLKQDDEFTPAGSRHWNSYRQYQKMVNLTKVIVDAGAGKAPALIGLAEVENDSVMQRLIHSTALWPWEYRYVMTHSDDVRGINVALLYQPYDFRLLSSESVKVNLPDGVRATRDLLHVCGRLVGGDTLDVIVCHLPSRMGGTRQSAPKRKAAHQALRHLCDSLERCRQHPHVLVMGDMNDSPDTRLLRRNMNFGGGLFNLMDSLQKNLRTGKAAFGTHKFQGKWSVLDQFWVNGNLLPGTRQVNAVPSETPRIWVDSIGVVCFPYMLVEDETHLGHRPKRTYSGYRYEGGFSDHLPIRLKLHIIYK